MEEHQPCCREKWCEQQQQEQHRGLEPCLSHQFQRPPASVVLDSLRGTTSEGQAREKDGAKSRTRKRKKTFETAAQIGVAR